MNLSAMYGDCRTLLLLGLTSGLGLWVPLHANAVQNPVDPATAVTGIDADVDRAMKEMHVPGVGVGVVVNGIVILEKGYGVREVGKPNVVDDDTLFDIGSMSKSFTATVVAAMVDDSQLGWDTPVISYLPWFRLYDPVANQLITPRDLLTHRSGLPRHDFIRYSTYLTREELLHRLRYLEPTHTLREVFQYNNLMYVVAGYLAGEVGGSIWENLVRQRIFLPVGMIHSNTSAVDLQQSDNFARPHDFVKGQIVTIPVYDYQKFGIGPNGAVNSCVADMLKYLTFHLANGKVGDRQVISVAQMEQLHRPVTVMPGGGTYALGWMVEYHRGHKILEHGGAINGFTSHMILLPEEQAGIVVLNNLGSDLPEVIADDLLDRLLGMKPEDYLAKRSAEDAQHNQRAASESSQFGAGLVPNTKTTLPLADYEGTYFNPAYGHIRVDVDGSGLLVKFDAINLSLTHYNYDTFSYEGSAIAQFIIGASGSVTEMLLPLEPAVKPFVFIKEQLNDGGLLRRIPALN